MTVRTESPKLCVSIATPDLTVLKRNLERAFDRVKPADFAEIRFDAINASDIKDALKVVEPYKERSIFTLRTKRQGGDYLGSEKEYGKLVVELGSAGPMLLDVEFRPEPILMQRLRSQGNAVLLSHHDWIGTSLPGPLRALMSEMASVAYGRVDKRGNACKNYIKIVSRAFRNEDAANITSLYEGKPDRLELVAFAMEKLGQDSRVVAGLRGPFTFVCLDDPVAPGQIGLEQMQRIYNMDPSEEVLRLLR